MSDEDKLAVELLAHRDSVAGSIMQMMDDVNAARSEAVKWRDGFCRLAARGSSDYESLKAKYSLPWENTPDSGA
jgi:hypothetical protein